MRTGCTGCRKYRIGARRSKIQINLAGYDRPCTLLLWCRKIQYDIGTMYNIQEVSRYLHDKLCTIRNRCAISFESEPSILIAHAKQSLSCKICLSCKYTLHILYRYVQCTANLYLYMVRYLHDKEIYVLRVKGERA